MVVTFNIPVKLTDWLSTLVKHNSWYAPILIIVVQTQISIQDSNNDLVLMLH